MIIAASTRSFSELNFEDVCSRLTDLEYDKVELWLSEQSNQLKPSEIASDPEKFVAQYKETTRLTPVAMYLEENVDASVLVGLSKLAKLLRITQITIPASPLGTPFNTEIDRLQSFLKITD